MKTRHHLILYSVLSLLLVGALFWGLELTLDGQEAQKHLEDVYAQRLYETQEHLQAISLKLGKTPIARDTATRVELLAGVSRQADGVVSALSALPLSHIAMSDTLRFCNQLAEYTLLLSLREAGGQPLTKQETQQLGELKNQCTLLLGQFSTAQQQMLMTSLRADRNVFYEAAQLSQRPLESVADPDNGMDYPTMIYDGAFSDARHAGEPKALGMQRVSQQQAIDIARAFVGEERVQSAQEGVPSGGPLESWGVTLTLTDGVVLNADVTKQGGKLLWIMPEHADFAPSLTLEECTQAALAFLSRNGYGPMEANHYQVYDGLAVINFVSVQDGVLLYPDLVKVQMRMDTGELVGLESNNYLMNHTARTGLIATLSQQEAKSRLHPDLKVDALRLCVIPYRNQERLCWEAAGWYDGREYRVYVDARTGEEVQILTMIDSVDGRLAA